MKKKTVNFYSFSVITILLLILLISRIEKKKNDRKGEETVAMNSAIVVDSDKNGDQNFNQGAESIASPEDKVEAIINLEPEISGDPQVISEKETASIPIGTPAVPVAIKPENDRNENTDISINPSSVASEINNNRKLNGLPAVTFDAVLNQAAQNKAQHMANNNYFAHTSPDGIDDLFFITQAGYKYSAVGVNIAMGEFRSSNDLVEAWVNSPGHRKNILADFGQELGIGIIGKYYVMIIGKPL